MTSCCVTLKKLLSPEAEPEERIVLERDLAGNSWITLGPQCSITGKHLVESEAIRDWLQIMTLELLEGIPTPKELDQLQAYLRALSRQVPIISGVEIDLEKLCRTAPFVVCVCEFCYGQNYKALRDYSPAELYEILKAIAIQGRLLAGINCVA